ncbi:MAG TPA: hypothetical protein VFQ12_04370 [Thermoleophilaceae bacterium]|jgi:hypothetical protein|nr:hypothetical protein [Thermoleophilaceae bacterium]
MRTITRLLVLAVAIMALAAGPAFAQTEDAYNGLAGAQQGGGGDAAAADTGGSLPFTGLELGLVAIAGAGLLGVGYAVRRASSTRESTP